MTDNTWGGARPGAGRKKVKPGTTKVQMTITITPEEKSAAQQLRSEGVDLNAALGAEILRLQENRDTKR